MNNNILNKLELVSKLGIGIKQMDEIVEAGKNYEYGLADYIGQLYYESNDAELICAVYREYGIDIEVEYADKILKIWKCGNCRTCVFEMDVEHIYEVMSNKEYSIEDKLGNFDMYESEDELDREEIIKIFAVWGIRIDNDKISEVLGGNY